MNYAAGKHFVSPGGALLGNPGGDGAPWDTVTEASMARHDTWLLSFVDILALLLTLFVLLLAFQDSETEPAGAALPANGEFSTDFTIPLDLLVRQQELLPIDFSVPVGYAMQGKGFLPVELNTKFAVAEIEEEGPALQVELIQQEELPDAATQVPSEADVAPHASVDPVEALLEVIEESSLHDQVDVTAHPGEVNLEISDSILFPRGSAELTDEGRVLLLDLAELFGGQPYTLSVEGHTDNIPIETTRYPSNWELSSARAAVVTRELIKQGIVPDRVRAIGYGATRPLADNDSPEGRARNRRVSFILQVDVQQGNLER